MKAMGLTQFGGPEVLHLLELPVPELRPGQIRIRVRAATVNPVDVMVRRGLAFVSDSSPPYVPGMEAAGVIEQIAEGTDTDLRVNDRVIAIVVVSGTHGAYAEQIVVPAESLVRAPKGISDIEAATLPMNGLTARMALDLLELSPGDTVAVVGAAGAVGAYAVQLAKAQSLRVIADASPKDTALVKALGADVVVPRGDQFASGVRQELPAGVDGLIDTAGIAWSVVSVVRDDGRVAVSAPGAVLPNERGIVSKRTFVPSYAQNRLALDQLRDLAESGQLTLRVARSLPVEQAVEAHQMLEAGGIRGRVVLTF